MTQAKDSLKISKTRPLVEKVYLDYGEVIYHDLPNVCEFNGNTTFSTQMERIESVRYSAALVVSGAWTGTSRVKLC